MILGKILMLSKVLSFFSSQTQGKRETIVLWEIGSNNKYDNIKETIVG